MSAPSRGPRDGVMIQGRGALNRGRAPTRGSTSTFRRGSGRGRGAATPNAGPEGLLQGLRQGSLNRKASENGPARGVRGRASPTRGQHAGRGHANASKTIIKTPAPISRPSFPVPISHKDFMNDMTAKFQVLKQRREAERAKAIRDGFLADPEKKTSLDKAITPVGTCTEMCPEFERVERIVQNMVDKAEKAPNEATGRDMPSETRMIKRFRRSAAGYDEQLPSDIRTPATLKSTLDYLLDKLVGGEDRLATIHKFVWDRTRGIRNDFSIQQVSREEDVKIAVDCFERIARFHILSLHQLSNPDNLLEGENFDAHQDREQLNNTLLSLMYYYDDYRRKISFPNESEFRAYCIVFELQSQHPDLEDRMQSWPKNLLEDGRIRSAFKLYASAGNSIFEQGPLRPMVPFSIAQGNAGSFWAVLQSKAVSYLMACVAEIYFSQVRFTALEGLWRSAKSAPVGTQARSQEWTLSELSAYLGFDTNEQTLDFCQAFNLSFRETDKGEQYLDLTSAISSLDKSSIPNQQIFSSFVERKRYRRTCVAVINGITVPQAIREGLVETEVEQDIARDEPGTENDQSSLFVPEKPASSVVKEDARSAGSFKPQAPSFKPQSGMPFGFDTSTSSPSEGMSVQSAASATPKSAWNLPSNSPFGRPSTFTPFAAPTSVHTPASTLAFVSDKSPAFPSTNDNPSIFLGAKATSAPEFSTTRPAPTPPLSNLTPPSPAPSTVTTAPPFQPQISVNQSQNTARPLFSSGFQVVSSATTAPAKPATFVFPPSLFPTAGAFSQVNSISTAAPIIEIPTQDTENYSRSLPQLGAPPSFPINPPSKSLFRPPPTSTPPPWDNTLPSSSPQAFAQGSTCTSGEAAGSPPTQVPTVPGPSSFTSQPTSSPPPKLQPFDFQNISTPIFDTQHRIAPGRTSSSPPPSPRSSPATIPHAQQVPGFALLQPAPSASAGSQPLKPIFTPADRDKAIDIATRLVLVQDHGLIDQYTRHNLPKILRETFEEFEQNRARAMYRSARVRYLASKYGRIWRNNTYYNNLHRRAKLRRRRIAETLREAYEKERKQARAEEELKEILEAQKEKDRIQEEQRQAKAEEDARREKRDIAKRAIERFKQESLNSRKRKSMVGDVGQTVRAETPRKMMKTHRRSRTVGSTEDHLPQPTLKAPYTIPEPPRRLALSLFSGKPSVFGSIPNSLPPSRSQDRTKTDYFRLKALGIDPDTQWVSQPARENREEEARRARIDEVWTRGGTSTRQYKHRSRASAAANIHAPLPECDARSSRPSSSQSATSIASQTQHEEFIRDIREVREALAEGTEWYKEQNAILAKEIEQQEEMRRSASSYSSPQTDAHGLATVNGYKYRPADINPGQSMSRTEQRIRATGAHGLATAPIGGFPGYVPWSKRLEVAMSKQSALRQSMNLETHGKEAAKANGMVITNDAESSGRAITNGNASEGSSAQEQSDVGHDGSPRPRGGDGSLRHHLSASTAAQLSSADTNSSSQRPVISQQSSFRPLHSSANPLAAIGDNEDEERLVGDEADEEESEEQQADELLFERDAPPHSQYYGDTEEYYDDNELDEDDEDEEEEYEHEEEDGLDQMARHAYLKIPKGLGSAQASQGGSAMSRVTSGTGVTVEDALVLDSD